MTRRRFAAILETMMRPTPKIYAIAFLLFASLGIPTTSATRGQATTIKIYAPRGNPGANCTRVYPLQRAVKEPVLLAGAGRALLAGPTADERHRGYGGWFSARTAGYLRAARIRAGVAYVDFRNSSRVIPNASASCGSALLLAQLNRTALQFRAVKRAVYSFNGSTRAFYEWLQREAPAVSRSPSLEIVKATVDRAARTADVRLRICFSSGPRALISVRERRTRRGVQQAAHDWIVPRAIEPSRISPFACRTNWRVNWLLKPSLTGSGTYTATLRVRDAYGEWTPPVAFSVMSP